MRKFYIYLIINLFAISCPYSSCKALPQQRSRQTLSTKKKQKRKRKRNNGLALKIVIEAFVIVILYFGWNRFLHKAENSVSEELRTAKRKLRIAQTEYNSRKEILNLSLSVKKQDFIVNKPEIVKNFTKEKLEKEWYKAIRTVDRKKIMILLNNKNINPSIQENDSDFDLIQCTDKQGYNVLHYAVLKVNYPLIQDLFNNHKARIAPLLNNLNPKGLSPMDIAYEKGCISILAYLDEQNAKLVKYATSPTT